MSLTGRIAYNTLIQMVGKAGAVIFGIVSIGLLTRYLGQRGFGEYTTAITFVQFFGILADLGLYIVAVKKIAEANDDTNRLFNNIFTLRLVSALVFVGLAPLVVLFFPYPALVKQGVLLLTLTTLFLTLNQLFVGLYQKSLAMGRAAVSEIIGKAVFLGLVVLAVFFQEGLIAIFIAFLLGSAAQFVVSFMLARRYVHLRLQYDPAVWREVLHESWPVALSIALNLVYFRADTIILSLFFPAATVGLYGASYKVLEVLVAFPAMFAGLVLPLLSRHAATGDHERLVATLQKAFDFLIMVSLPMVAGLFLLAHPIMTLVAGSDFAFAGSILRVLAFAAGSIFVGNLFGNAVVALGRQRSMLPIYAVVAVCSLVGYFLLIPRFGVWGASGMTVATELAITLGSIFVVWRALRFRLSLRHAGKALFATLLMAATLVLVRSWSLAFVLPLGAAVYGVGLTIVRGIHRGMIRDVLAFR